MKGKRITTYVLALVMVVATLSFTPVVEPVEAATTAAPITYTSGTYTLKDVNITGSTGQSAVTINGDVTLNIEGTVKLTGGNAGYEVGAGAGIEVPAGSTLTLKGNGNLIVIGGNGSNGQDGLSPKGQIEPDPEDLASVFYIPRYYNAGKGGGGAGAGIGSKGADNSNSIITTGNINISDKQLQIKATGGKGGNAGGKGGNGSGGFIVSFEEHSYVAGMTRNQDIVGQGGYGGGGGGGAGYPAAGIGSGGAAGSHGGEGGSGARDQGKAWIMYSVVLYLSETGWWNCGGGGGGGGGQGYVNGGGGGGGAYLFGRYNAKYGGWLYDEPSTGGKGGQSNQDGATGTPYEKIYEERKATAGAGGMANGQAGKSGIGKNSVKYGTAGVIAANAGNKGNSGNVILTAGTLSATSGGGNAQDIGSGDGNGEHSGNFSIIGGSVNPNSTKFNVKGDPVYPVTVRPSTFSAGANATTDIKVNGKDWGLSHFYTPQDGSLVLWLPNGNYKVEVANAAGIYDNTYEFTVNGKALEPAPNKNEAKIDLSKGNVTFEDTKYVQGSVTGAYSGNATLYSSDFNVKNSIIYKNNGKQSLTLENANVDKLELGNAQVDVCSLGINSKIATANVTKNTSNLSFYGDETSELSIDTIQSDGAGLEYSYYPYEFISDIAVASSNNGDDAAKKYLTDKGYTVYYDKQSRSNINLNRESGGFSVFLGYKTTKDPNNAIRDIKILDRGTTTAVPNKTATFNNKTYTVATGLGANNWNSGDLNMSNSGHQHLYLYYSKDKSAGNPIYNFYAYQNSTYDATQEPAKFAYDTFESKTSDEWKNRWVYGRKENSAQLSTIAYNTNTGNKGYYIYLGYASVNVTATSSSPYLKARGSSAGISNNNILNLSSIDANQANHHAGSITMNSKGKVIVGKIQAPGKANKMTNGKITNPDVFYGTPSLTVNSGYMVLQTYLAGNKLENATAGKGTMYIGSPPIVGLPSSSWLHSLDYTNYEYRLGNNKIGDVTVNGGTLQIGNDGKGTMNIPTAFTDSGSYTKPVTTVNSGGNLLSNETSSLAANRIKLEITGLPQNNHLSLIKRTDNESYLGDYPNFDATTNNNGNFITYVTAADNDKYLKFVDEAGNAYQYRISVLQNSASATKVSLPNLSSMSSCDNLIRVYPKYIVSGGALYDHNEGQAVTLNCNASSGIETVDHANLILNTNSQRTISKITGDGNLTLQGAGINITGELSVPMVTVKSGIVSLKNDQVKSIMKIVGGSVNNGSSQPLQDVQDSQGPIYRAIIPDWAANIKVNGKNYVVNTGSTSSSTMELYLPESTKTVQVGSGYYYLELVGNEFKVTKQLAGNGVINISNSDAQILNDEQYIIDGKLYRKSVDVPYVVSGKGKDHQLLISGGTSSITLNNVVLDNSSKSPIKISTGVDATLTLTGKNILSTASNYPAIHVPENTTLKIAGTGNLTATGGVYVAAIGGGVNEKNGKITINGGTLDLVGTLNPAVGAGGSQISNEGSVVINGGSIKVENTMGGNGFSVTPQNAQGQALSQLTITPDSASEVKVDGKDYYINETNDDGNLYLYVVSSKHTVSAGGKDYQIVPLSVNDSDHGSIALYRIDQNGEKIRLNNGDMVVEGAQVYVNSIAQEGYGLKNGPATGTYIVKSENNELILYPLSGTSTSVDLNNWQPVVESSGDDGSKITGFEKEITAAKVEEISLGAASKGTTVVTFKAKGQGIKLEIMVNGEAVKTVTLSNQEQDITYEWQSDDNDEVKLRLSGEGTAFLGPVFMSNPVKVDDMSAIFAKTVTLTLIQPDDHVDEDGKTYSSGYILAKNSDGRAVIDRNSMVEGTQVFGGDKVSFEYVNLYNGNIFDYFVVNDSETHLNNFESLTVEQDVTIKSVTHIEPYYSIVIPETVELEDEGTEAQITAAELKNMADNDSVEVKIKSGLQNNGVVLKRIGANNTLSVPLKGSNNTSLNNGSLVATFKKNSLTASEGGRLYFGTPAGDKKAGKYTSEIVFEIEYITGK